MRKCCYCNRMVEPVKKINWFVLLLMTIITGGLWLFIYTPYYVFKLKSCPICGGKKWEK